MKHHNVVIVGGGQAGYQVAASLRELGYEGTIRLIAEETYLPYQRPPLSKTFIKEDDGPEKTYLRPASFYADKRIDVTTGHRAIAIDRDQRTIALQTGERLGWDQLVLATGVSNRQLPVPGAALEGVVTLRGLDDAQLIRRRLKDAKRLVIVGGGVIGLEISALVASLGIEVVLVELTDRLAGRIGSQALSDHLLQVHRALGATVHLKAGVDQLEGRDGAVAAVRLSTGETIAADLVLISIGVVPNAELAQAAGITIDDGIIVDQHMRTSDPNILAVGDCTRFAPPFGPLDSVRLESVQNAIDQARCAAETLTGKPRAYDALPWFWSDQGSLKLQIAGLSTGHDHTVIKADAAKAALSVYCFAGQDLIGVECINRPADFVAARRVLGQRKPVRPADVAREDFQLKAHL